MQKKLTARSLRLIPIKFFRRFPKAKRFLLGVAYRFNLLEVLFKMSRALGGRFPVLADNKLNFMGSLVFDVNYWDAMMDNYASLNLKTTRPTFSSHTLRAEPLEKVSSPIISVISSLYKSDVYIETFLGDLVSQESFEEIEFYLVLVTPSDYVLNLVTQANRMYPNIRFEKLDNLIGIYEAWNIAIRKTSAPFLTNANADDIRKDNSFVFQARTMELYPWVDVLYQDIFLAYEFDTNWMTIESINLEVKMGHVTEAGLVLSGVNYPHHAPAWRRDLHGEVGYFNENYKSASDYEFWIRCAKADKTFFKSRYKHVGYYLNPDGLSTSQNSVGAQELFQIQRQFAIKVPSRNQIESREGIEDYKNLDMGAKLTYANHLVFPEKITRGFIQEILALRVGGRK